jgi:hypothetical protein
VGTSISGESTVSVFRTLKIESVSFFEILVITHQAIQGHNSEDYSVNPRVTCYERYVEYSLRASTPADESDATSVKSGRPVVELSRELSVFRPKRG